MSKKRIEEEFKILNREEENKLTKEELMDYYKKLREYYKKIGDNQKNLNLKKAIHPILLKIMKIALNKELIIFNKEMPKIEGPVIYAVNHTNCHDVPAITQVIKKHMCILAGAENLRLIDKTLFNLNGVVFVNRDNKNSKRNSKEEVIKVILNGNSLLIFPEGTWNISENKPMLPLNWGIVEIAQKTNVPVIPIALEYQEDKYFANIGDPIFFDIKEDKKDGIIKLRDSLATLRWEIWEKYNNELRKNVSLDAFKQKVESNYDEYEKMDRNYEQSLILKDGINAEEVFNHLKTLEYNKKNAFLIGKNKKMF